MISRKVDDIEYRLLPGSDRKTTDIVIERNGMVAVRPPKSFKPEQVDEVVRSKRLWIYRNLAEWRDLNASAVVREWVNGEAFLYLGRCYRLLLVDDQQKELQLKNGRFRLKRSLIERGGQEAAQNAFVAFYTDKGVSRIHDRLDYYAPKVGVKPAGLEVKDMGYRWASCSKKNELSFHWKCMMAPATIIDYIVVHELCHMHFRNHTEAFWNELDKVMPDYRERKEWLKKHGAAFSL